MCENIDISRIGNDLASAYDAGYKDALEGCGRFQICIDDDNVEMAFRIVDLLTEQDLVRIGSALIYAFEDSEYCLASYKRGFLGLLEIMNKSFIL